MSRREGAIHDPACSIWDVPADSQPEALLAAGVRDEDMVAYLSAVRPLYDALKRCLGQMGGVLLLLQARGLERGRGDVLMTSIRTQLDEAGERLRCFPVPPKAGRHHAMLTGLAKALCEIRGRLERTVDLIDPSSVALGAVVDALFGIHRGLLATADPGVGLSPVDFTAACCTCRPRTKAHAA